MTVRARRPRRLPLAMALAAFAITVLMVAPMPARAADDPLDTLAGPPSSRFT